MRQYGMNEKLVTLFTESCNRIRMYSKNNSTIQEWIISLNQILAQHDSKIKIVEWFGSTDNYVLKLPKAKKNDAVDIFETCTKIKGISLSLSELYWLINKITSMANHKNISGVNWGVGVGLQIKGTRRYFEDFNNGLVSVHCMEPGVAAIIRMQYIARQQPPQKRKKQVEWIKVSKTLNNRLKGEWTTKNIQSLEGIFQRALMHYDRK